MMKIPGFLFVLALAASATPLCGGEEEMAIIGQSPIKCGLRVEVKPEQFKAGLTHAVTTLHLSRATWAVPTPGETESYPRALIAMRDRILYAAPTSTGCRARHRTGDAPPPQKRIAEKALEEAKTIAESAILTGNHIPVSFPP